jgi:hypothetical protein
MFAGPFVFVAIRVDRDPSTMHALKFSAIPS